MQYFILHDFTDADIMQGLREVSALPLQRYDNPFEQKDFLEHKEDLLHGCPALSWMVDELRDTVRMAHRLLNLPIAYSEWSHYGGLFRYNPGDYLAPHVDAGVHPKLGTKKVATLILYLTDATLSFWSGDSCTLPDPEVWLESQVQVRPGEAILFPNHDEAWHGVPKVTYQHRVCLTVSYMAYPGFTHSRYRNARTRAYFARRHGVQDGLDDLRQQRASEEHHTEVYRI